MKTFIVSLCFICSLLPTLSSAATYNDQVLILYLDKCGESILKLKCRLIGVLYFRVLGPIFLVAFVGLVVVLLLNMLVGLILGAFYQVSINESDTFVKKDQTDKLPLTAQFTKSMDAFRCWQDQRSEDFPQFTDKGIFSLRRNSAS